MHTLLIFAGAGASKAVNPAQYPTTVEFFDALPESITREPTFKHVEAFLRHTMPDQRLDVELLLWRLQELRAYCESSTDVDQLPGWLHQNGRFVSMYGQPNTNIGNFQSIARSIVQQLDRVIGEINQKVYDLYAELPKKDDLARTWTPLLEGCVSLGVRTEIVTTNYDMIIESAIDGNAAADNGWRGSVYRVLDSELWSVGAESQRKGLLTKLHGSVNWSRQGQTVYVSDPTFKGQHENHAIIYPGFKGRPSDPMFLSFHEHFRRVLRGSKVAIFIGFAFRDPYINDICANSVASGTTCIVINPQKVPLPFTVGESVYVEGPFERDSVRTALDRAREALGGA